MATERWKYLDGHLRLRLADLEPWQFELFFLHFLRAGISLTIQRHGQLVTKRVISAETYAAGSGRSQKGIDLRAVVEGGEVWVFQCKRHKTWSPAQARQAIEAASKYQANHYFLVVACDPHEDVQDEIHKHPDWTFWNLDTICAEFRLRVPPTQQPKIVSFLHPAELKRFVPFATQALVTPQDFFERYLGERKLFRHDWKLVGRDGELAALANFLADPSKKVLLLVSKGGEGKSRLLWEFTRDLPHRVPGSEALFLNPHSKDEPEFAFLTDTTKRLLVIDDAHRAEDVPVPLLSLAAKDPSAKVILATRPQGMTALDQKLFEAGLASSLETLPLPRLKKAFAKDLAEQALGPTLAKHAAALVELTSDSPFLAVLAGDLLRQGKLRWDRWASQKEFRRHVFRAFEEENLRHVLEEERKTARGLLRSVALLAPVRIDRSFVEKVAVCLGSTPYQIEAVLQNLRRTELIVGNQSVRIVPDLLADFLVYDACFEPSSRMPVFVGGLLSEFADASPALLRNLAESAWIAQADGVLDDSFLRPLIEAELKRFERSSFYARSQQLKHWFTFCVFLPGETLELARRAISLTSAPPDTELSGWGNATWRMDSHQYVLEHLPELLGPIAKHHHEYRGDALDLLWELGLGQSWAGLSFNQSHPWAVIAEVIKYEPKKPVDVTLDALDWLAARVRKLETLNALESTAPILKTLLGPCFERFVEYTWREGHTLTWCHRAVSIPITEPIREKALEILAWVIEHGSWLAALNALSALEAAIHRVAPVEAARVKDEAKFRSEWRPERLKALAVYELAIATHSSVAVRYELRQTLRRNLSYEEDPAFAKEGQRVLAKIKEDLALRVAVVVSSQGAFEFEGENGGPRTDQQFDQIRKLWNARVRDIASELVASFPAADGLFGFLQPLAGELVQAGNHLFLGPLFGDLSQTAPDLALGLASRILDAVPETPLVREWPALLTNTDQVGEEQKTELFKKAARSQIAGASAAVVRAMSWQARENRALSEAERELLLEIAARACTEEAIYLLQLVEWSGEANLPWAFRILETLPIREVAPQILDHVLRAIVPYRERKTILPRAVVQHVLKQLVEVRELDLYHHSHEWNVLLDAYPREIYELVRERIAHAASGRTEPQYRPIPTGHQIRLHLPALAKERDFPAICDELWTRVTNPDEKTIRHWVQLFQAVVFADRLIWPSRMLNAIEGVRTEHALLRLAQLLRFEGSLIIFRFPEITRAFLKQAMILGRDELCEKVRSGLCDACGPQVRSYSRGVLDQELDYVEAEAAKAAEAHASDELLGPFYRRIVEVEQRSRLTHRMQAEAHMASLD